MRNPLTRSNGTESDSRARTAATPTDLPRERVGPVDETRARQREEFGGFSFGSVFFGWLVAIGLAVLLTAVLTAAGTAIGIAELDDGELSDNAETIGLLGGILLFAVLFLSYYAGGYVAGRLARFDGSRQGFGVWILGVLVTVAFAALAALAGSEWNVFEQLDLPRIPVDEGTLTTGGAITLAAIVLGTLLAGIAGGKVGERFHRKVDRVAFDTPPER
jgi:amino acid transporter